MSYNNSANYAVNEYDLITGGSENLPNSVSPGTQGYFAMSNGTSSQVSFQMPTVASNIGTSASPTGTTSTTYVNMGLGSSWNLTPKSFGNIRIRIDGNLTNSANTTASNLILCYGTGSAPSNGTAATGTTLGLNLILIPYSATYGLAFAKNYIITGLTPGTAYWFDLQLKAVTTGTASLLNLTFSAQEFIS